MCAKTMILRILRVLGRKIVWTKGGVSQEFRGYLNPLREKTKLLLPTETGRLDSGIYLLLFPVSAETQKISTGDSFLCDGETYWIQSLRKLYFGDEAAYLWGLASREEGAEIATLNHNHREEEENWMNLI